METFAQTRNATVFGVALALAVLFTTVACGPLDAEGRVPSLSGGIQVNEPDPERWVQAVHDIGLDAIQVTVYARQQAWSSIEMILPDSAASVVDEIRAAKRRGLRVVMVLRVALEQGLPENRHLWHGMIWPAREELDQWFASYREFALWGAGIAEAEGVDLLAVASELSSLTSTVQVTETPNLYAYFMDPERTAQVRQRLVDCAATVPAEDLAPDLEFLDGERYEDLDAYLRAEEEANRRWSRHITQATRGEEVDVGALNARRADHEAHWRRLIEEIRGVYGGPLSYAANFDQVEEVGFWDALDAIGVNAYYPLSRWGMKGSSLEGALAESWRGIAGRLNDLAKRHGGPGRVLPVLLFELGWTRKAGSTVRPFSYDRVEVLETAGETFDGSPPLTCVHWATQPDDPQERVRALEALLRVVEEGSFPTLRGFMLWKLSTRPQHRAIEPFVVVVGDGSSDVAAVDEDTAADAAYIDIAGQLAARLRRSTGLGR